MISLHAAHARMTHARMTWMPWLAMSVDGTKFAGTSYFRPSLSRLYSPSRRRSLTSTRFQPRQALRAPLSLAFIATLMDSNVEFIAADNPHANRLTVHILAAVAKHERAAISEHMIQ